MASSLSNLADNLAEGIHKIKCNKKKHENNKCEIRVIKCKDLSATLNTKTLKMI